MTTAAANDPRAYLREWAIWAEERLGHTAADQSVNLADRGYRLRLRMPVDEILHPWVSPAVYAVRLTICRAATAVVMARHRARVADGPWACVEDCL